MDNSELGYRPVDLTPRQEVVRREALTSEAIGSLVAGIGNHEGKAIAFGLMEEGTSYKGRLLQRTLRDAHGGHEGWDLAHTVLVGYCRDSFKQAGIVGETSEGYKKNEYGEEVGDAFAGLVLDFSLKHPDFSLIDFFSQRQSTPRSSDEDVNRAPITRMRIFWELLTRDLPLKNDDIAVAVKQRRNVVARHLHALDEKGVITYTAIPHNGLRSVYKYKPELSDVVPKYLAREMPASEFSYNLLRDNPEKEFTLEEVASLYFEHQGKQPGTITKIQRDRFSNILSNLERQGILEVNDTSIADLTDTQKDVVFELVTMLDGFQSQDPNLITYGKKRLTEIISNPELVAQLLLKARKHSPNGESRSSGVERGIDILERVQANPLSSSNSIFDSLRQDEVRISNDYVIELIADLVKDGSLEVTISNGQRLYSVSGGK